MAKKILERLAMSDSVTIEDIYQLFRASSEEFDRRLRESDRRAEEAKLESARRLAEIERIFTESKTERDRSMAKLEQTVERTSRAVDSQLSSDDLVSGRVRCSNYLMNWLEQSIIFLVLPPYFFSKPYLSFSEPAIAQSLIK